MGIAFLEYLSRGGGFESYNGHFYSHQSSQLVSANPDPSKIYFSTLSRDVTPMALLVWKVVALRQILCSNSKS